MSIIVAGAMEYLDDDRVIASDNTASLRATYLQWVEVTGTTRGHHPASSALRRSPARRHSLGGEPAWSSKQHAGGVRVTVAPGP